MTIPPSVSNSPRLVYVDRDDVSETFSHSLRRWSVDGVNLHLEFAAHRMSDPLPDAPEQPLLKAIMHLANTRICIPETPKPPKGRKPSQEAETPK